MTARKFGKIILSQLLCLCAAFTACTDDDVISQSAGRTPLQVTVNANNPKVSRSIVHGEWLPDASTIGVSLFTPADDYADYTDYDGQGYYNIKYTASGEEDAQTWAPTGVTPSISANEAALVAYYPYSDAEDLDITAIPVEIATQTDYMYSTPVTAITNASPKANITLYHALTAIRVKLVLGNFTGSADVTDVTVSSPALASEATLNAFDGALSNITGQGEKFTLAADYTLTTTGTDNDIMFVPDASVTSGSTTVSATIGGKKYTAGITFAEAYKQGYIYTYTLTLNNTGFEVTKVNVTPWQTGTDSAASLEPEKDNTYVIKIVASYSAAAPTSLLSTNISSRAGETFYFHHNVSSEFVGTIDWGDGTIDTYTEESSNDTKGHTYPYDGQEYTITVKGNIKELEAFDESFQQCLKEIIYIGKDCGITSMCGAFYGCTALTEIPEGLFDACTEVTDFNSTFSYCSGLQSIPVGLFDKCTKVTDFQNTFQRCSALTEIPEGLFDKCTEVTSFGSTFYGCKSLTNIPEGLFDYNTKVTDFGGTFNGCTGLQSIPEGLFDNNSTVTSFYMTFYRCTSLQSIPEGLFDNCTKVTNFHSTFSGCSALTEIPEGLFDKCTEVTSFGWTFSYCTSLQSIPEGLFDKCIKVTDFKSTFYGCTSLTGESPYSTIQVDGVDTKVHLYERSAYPDYFTAPTSYTDCFIYCTGLTDYTTMSTSYSTWI